MDYIKIGSSPDFGEFGWVYLKNEGLFYLWWSEVWPEELTAFDRVKHSMWVSLLKEAMVHDLDVELLTEDPYSSKVLTVRLIKP